MSSVAIKTSMSGLLLGLFLLCGATEAAAVPTTQPSFTVRASTTTAVTSATSASTNQSDYVFEVTIGALAAVVVAAGASSSFGLWNRAKKKEDTKQRILESDSATMRARDEARDEVYAQRRSVLIDRLEKFATISRQLRLLETNGLADNNHQEAIDLFKELISLKSHVDVMSQYYEDYTDVIRNSTSKILDILRPILFPGPDYSADDQRSATDYWDELTDHLIKFEQGQPGPKPRPISESQ